MLEILLFPLLTALCIVVVAGPLGCFVVWRRMAYFGDTLAHSALMGIALALIFSINIQLSIVASCIGLALLLARVQQQQSLSGDTWLGIYSHACLAIGLISISLAGEGNIDLYAYLFGDLLAANLFDFLLIAAVSSLILLFLYFYWRPLLSICLNEDLAQVEGIAVAPLRAALMVAFALLTAMAMKVVGVLLITALLIIPAAAARPWCKSPHAMAVLASLIGLLSLGLGMLASLLWDIPTGPSIVSAASALFMLSQLRRSRSY